MTDGLKGTILENATMKPMMVLAPGIMSAEHQQMLRDNGLCVVEAEKPELVRFMDPISTVADRSRIEQAAIEMSRLLLNRRWGHVSTSALIGHGEFARLFCDCLVAGTSLAGNYVSPATIFKNAKRDEIQRLAREEAKAERKAAKEKAKQ